MQRVYMINGHMRRWVISTIDLSSYDIVWCRWNKDGLMVIKLMINIDNIQIWNNTNILIERFVFRFRRVSLENFLYLGYIEIRRSYSWSIKIDRKIAFSSRKNWHRYHTYCDKTIITKETKSKIWFHGDKSGEEFFLPLKDKSGPDYIPKAMDFTSVTMNREMQELSEALSQNAHEVWAKQMKNRLAAIGTHTFR